MMRTLSNTNLIVLTSICLMTMNYASADNGMTYQQANAMIDRLNDTFITIKAWSEDNTQKANRLEKYFVKENSREEDNYLYQNKDAWNEVKALNQNSMMLLEASYAFAKSTESAAGYSEDSIRSRAWTECLKSESCSFRRLNQMIDNDALAISAQTKDNAIKTQKMLLESIDKLNEFSMQSEETIGLNDSIDTLSKVNATQANALVQLTAQISDLNKISAHEITKSMEKEKLKDKADELFLFNGNETRSHHLNVTM